MLSATNPLLRPSVFKSSIPQELFLRSATGAAGAAKPIARGKYKNPSIIACARYPTRAIISTATLFPKKEPRFRRVARLATELRNVSGLECSTRIVFSEIFPRTNASPAGNTPMAEIQKPGLLEITRKLQRPNTMLVESATRTEVRSVNQPANGAQTDWAST